MTFSFSLRSFSFRKSEKPSVHESPKRKVEKESNIRESYLRLKAHVSKRKEVEVSRRVQELQSMYKVMHPLKSARRTPYKRLPSLSKNQKNVSKQKRIDKTPKIDSTNSVVPSKPISEEPEPKTSIPNPRRRLLFRQTPIRRQVSTPRIILGNKKYLKDTPKLKRSKPLGFRELVATPHHRRSALTRQTPVNRVRTPVARHQKLKKIADVGPLERSSVSRWIREHLRTLKHDSNLEKPVK
ncbi:hypothetical protein L596_012140 [Steinernema carpocapsae]|uniref:Uncharacterized protein n=1 Tax=Steinernema carpocapsae TaxID=34508 RepID=A0A4U5NW37_STECR|nr:hypothetical protein L596_012140 [Steinernema carpocapsae]